MFNKLSISDFLNDAIRILIIALAVKDKKSIRLTEHKIKLCDYYLKFPCTMFGSRVPDESFKENFDEYYAFFHWQPEVAEYRQSTNFSFPRDYLRSHLLTVK